MWHVPAFSYCTLYSNSYCSSRDLPALSSSAHSPGSPTASASPVQHWPGVSPYFPSQKDNMFLVNILSVVGSWSFLLKSCLLNTFPLLVRILTTSVLRRCHRNCVGKKSYNKLPRVLYLCSEGRLQNSPFLVQGVGYDHSHVHCIFLKVFLQGK